MMTLVTCDGRLAGTSSCLAVSAIHMRKPSRHDAKLFGGFGIFPFSLAMLCALLPAFCELRAPIDRSANAGLPRTLTAHSLRGASREDALNVMVTRDASFYLNERKLSTSELSAEVRKAVALGSPPRAYIRADRHAAYGAVKLALDAVRDAGIEQVSFITENQ